MTLPIVVNKDDFFLHVEEAKSYTEKIKVRYQKAKPYPHIVIDDFLPQVLADRLVSEFPAPDEQNHHTYNIGYLGSSKRQYRPEACSPFCRQFFRFLNSQPFLEFLEALTGHHGLIGDPHFEGGGFHETLSTGKLGVHADFRIHKRLNLLRRINFLLYLNPEWDTQYGGDLEIWDRDMTGCVHSIPPIFNRCVIFSTDATSFHGHPEPLRTPAEITRRSIATYYYTASSKVWTEVKKSRTNFIARPNESSEIKRKLFLIRIRNYFRRVVPHSLWRRFF